MRTRLVIISIGIILLCNTPLKTRIVTKNNSPCTELLFLLSWAGLTLGELALLAGALETELFAFFLTGVTAK